jgi:hypothetical protein
MRPTHLRPRSAPAVAKASSAVTALSDDLRYDRHVAAQPRPAEQRLRVIEALLRLLPDVLLAEQGAGADRSDTRLPALGVDYRDPETLAVFPHWLELERCLAVMAHERNWQRAHVIAFFQAPTRTHDAQVNVQALDRYKVPRFNRDGEPIWERNDRGKIRTKPGRVNEPVIAGWVSETEARHGLAWIEERYSHAAYKSAEAALAKLRAA